MKKVITITTILLFGIFLGGCVPDDFAVATTTEEKVSANQRTLEAVRPLPQLGDSLERRNIIDRLELWNNDNKVSYIYLTEYGKVMAFYTIKGKVTSSGKRLTPNDQLKGCDGGEWNQECVMEAPSLDGTYGSSDSYIFFWTTEGAYVQWGGNYMLVDQPLKLTTQPELIRVIQ